MLKRQQFKNGENNNAKLSISKYQQFDKYNNKKEQGLVNYKGKSKGKRYIIFPFITLFFLFYKKSNCPVNLSEAIKDLNHFICILKIC